MVKDEDLCVHCGLCAERCPTAAWDMQKSTINLPLRHRSQWPSPQQAQDRVNDFVIKIANVNGTGSASANAMMMKSIFRMGVPVMGKNYFPSNIQGLPTWYEIRVTKDGYVARSGRVDLMVAMNAETYQKDVRDVSPGRLPDLRLDLAALGGARARGHHDPRRAAGEDSATRTSSACATAS